MQSIPSRTWPRLLAEFTVIVVGVLVALSVDSYVSWRSDRVLEREYLERLYEDVQYDLAELEYVEEIAVAALAYLDTLSNPSVVRDLEATRLVGTMVVASSSREADLSRSTFLELVNSGRIGLIRSRTVRTELAEYDRIVNEMSGYWVQVDTRFQDWVLSQVPYAETRAFEQACGEVSADRGVATTRACPFPWTGRSVDALRTEIGTAAVQGLIRYQTNRLGATVDIVRLLRGSARALGDTLAEEMDTAGG